jgi:hypothetical protein
MAKIKRIRRYSDFSLDDLTTLFAIENRQAQLNLTVNAQKVLPSQWLIESLQKSLKMPLNSEKAKSEWLIVPVLTELHESNLEKFNIFSGNSFDVLPEKFLKGRCDYLLNKGQSVNITAPVIGIFEAKDDSLEKWYGQCGAEMLAAQLFNQQHNNDYAIIYGAVTNGYEWIFLRLEEKQLLIDNQRYYLQDLSPLLTALQTVVGFYD